MGREESTCPCLCDPPSDVCFLVVSMVKPEGDFIFILSIMFFPGTNVKEAGGFQE